ncbi:YeiH family protein [Aequorivita vladivostokensis]|uniref:Membrane protein n=1 Tax=Aequorivita vladivostokensis TaxID=171194 RepID=A0ABR5DI36_9FLAO|nr:putative sulfate exporter family transporter [Aequorivita vladivostokensis]KJJ38450.1 membrane protein [Aequorivita vladivostokensis]MAB58421.1 putative sulfate exporter family transporter [Aequorivita sp.]MBF29833.1 putative sulfate exporter family transporter [Aequorivita sp.]
MKSWARQNETLVKVLFIICMVLCILGYVSSPVALVGGFLFSYFLGHPFLTLNSKAVNWLLKIAVVGLGFGMNLKETLAAGQDGFLLTVFSISATLILGYFLGRLLKMNKKSSHLISSGTAICGGSAIAAVSPVINASEKDISISLGVIFLLNSIALIVFPPLGHLLDLNQHQFGLWCAIAIHDTSSVVGAAYTFGEEALKVATTVKLARALWIIPLSLLSVFLFKGKGKSVKIPYFIFLFILAIILNSYLPIPEILTTGITSISKSLLVLTLFLIGAGLSMDKIKSAGWKPMILGFSLWVFISVSAILVILVL